MSAPKGYSSGTSLDRLAAKFATVEPIRLDQFGLSVLAHQFVYSVGTDAVDSATTSVVTAASHDALKGDIIRFTSGTHSGREIKVDSVTTDTITLAEDLSAAPAALVTFQILRHKYPVVTSTGGLTSTFSYTLDSVSQDVLKDTGTPANNKPLPVELVDSSGNINKVSATQSGTWNITNVTGTVSLPTGAATSAKQPALGTAGTASADVISVQGIASMTALKVDGSAVTQPVSGTFWQTTQPVSGTFWQATQPVSGTFWQSTQPVSAVDLPLPTGAATSAKQPALGTAGTASSDVISVQGIASMTALKVDGSAVTQPVSGTFWQATQPVSGTVSATQSGTWTVQPGNTANTTAWLTKSGGKASANAPARNDYSSVNVTTSAYVQLVASTTSATTEIEIFDSSGQTLALAVGAAASEVIQLYIFPGGNGRVPLAIPASSRVSVKAISATASSGEIDINFYT